MARPDDFDGKFRAGVMALQGNDLASAELNLVQAVKLKPESARAWIGLAQTYWKENKLSDAEEAAGKASANAASDLLVWRSLAMYYTESNQPEKMGEAGCRAGAPDCFPFIQSLLQHQQFAHVVSILDAMPAQVSHDAQMQLALGVAFYGLRRFDQAADAFFSTIRLSPKEKQPYLFLGKILEQIPSRLPEATTQFESLERLYPAVYEGYYLHAKALNAAAASPDTARKLLERSIAISGGVADIHFELALVLERTQHLPEAVAEFERASSLSPSDAAVHYRLARLYQRLGKVEAADVERERHRQIVTAQNSAR